MLIWIRQVVGSRGFGFLPFSFLSLVPFVLLISSSLSFPQNAREIKKHIVAYRSYSAEEIQHIASHFDIIDVASPDIAEKIKSLNPEAIAILYENLMGVHPSNQDWEEVNNHEDWFIHDDFGHRLKNDGWCWYLMDPASGWKDYLSNLIRERLDRFPILNGIFADDCWLQLYTTKWHIDIENEAGLVNNDGITVTTKYSIWEGPAHGTSCQKEVGVQGVYDNLEHKGINYFESGSYSGQTIVLGTSLPPGKPVYIEYGAKDNDLFRPPQEKVDSFHPDILSMLECIKTKMMDDELLIMNPHRGIDYLDVVDGKMYEGFLTGTSSDEDIYPNLMEWSAALKNQKDTVAKKKIFLAHSGTLGTSGNEQLIEQKAMFCLTSHLLVYDPAYSSFGFAVGEVPITYYPEWDAPIGEPKGEYYLLERGNPGINLIPNPSFEEDLTDWSVLEEGDEGTPNISSSESFEGTKSAHFVSNAGEGSSIGAGYISVEPNTTYRLSAWIKGSNIVHGGSWWKKMGLWGWWYDEDYNQLSQFNLLFPEDEGVGNFDWTYLSDSQESPPEAAYYRVARLGFVGGPTGEGWIDDVRFIKDIPPYEYIIYAREFSNGLVLVNMGTGNHTVSLEKTYLSLEGKIVDHVTLGSHEGAILVTDTSGPLIPPRNLRVVE